MPRNRESLEAKQGLNTKFTATKWALKARFRSLSSFVVVMPWPHLAVPFNPSTPIDVIDEIFVGDVVALKGGALAA